MLYLYILSNAHFKRVCYYKLFALFIEHSINIVRFQVITVRIRIRPLRFVTVGGPPRL